MQPSTLKRLAGYACLLALTCAGHLPSFGIGLPNATRADLSPEKIANGDPASARKALSANYFEANHGQLPSPVAFAARTFAGGFYITKDGTIVHSLLGATRPGLSAGLKKLREPNSWDREAGVYLLERPINAAPVQPAGGRESAQSVRRVSAIFGEAHAHSISAFDSVDLGELWPQVSLRLIARDSNVEKVFAVSPGGDPKNIRMQIQGATLDVGFGGALRAQTKAGDIAFTPPVAWQIYPDGKRVSVSVSYRVESPSTYGFDLGAYDPSLPLVIDPLLQSTYLGGAGADDIRALATDPVSGDVFVAGFTQSAAFPKALAASGVPSIFNAGAGDNGSTDAFVARLSPDLTIVRQVTLIGGSGSDVATSLQIDAAGNVYVGGYTYSTDFPTTAGAAQLTKSGGSATPDGFVVKLNGALTTLLAGTYLGGASIDAVNALALSDSGLVVTGQTASGDFPLLQPLQGTLGGGKDAFLTLMNPATLALVRSTYLGGAADDEAFALTVDSSVVPNNIYVAGQTYSGNFPAGSVNANQLQPNRGNGDAFVALFSSSLQTRSATVYLGGAGSEAALAIAFDSISSPNAVLVSGYTDSTDFPAGSAGAGVQAGLAGGTDAFIARLTPGLDTLLRTTYFGGGGDDFATAMLIHPSGDIFVTGFTDSGGSPAPIFPGVSIASGGANNGVQSTRAGSTDAFVSRMGSNLLSLVQSTFLGGKGTDAAYAIALSSLPAPNANSVVIAGYSASNDLLGSGGGAQAVAMGGGDAFVSVMTSNLAAGTGDPLLSRLLP
jgi:hypothetical protein